MSARRIVMLVALACAAMALLGLSVGSTGWQVPWRWTEGVVELRAPRVVLASAVGAALAVAGVAMQSLLYNDLADPYLLGMSGGASAGAVTALAIWPDSSLLGPAAAVGAAAAALLVRALVRGLYDPTKLVLAGVAVSSILASATGLVLVLAPASQLLRSTTYWLFGGLGSPQWGTVAVAVAGTSVSLWWLATQARRLDRMILGADVATALGVDTLRLRRGVLIAAVALTAIAVATGGLIGFVGLIAPHIARRMVGQSHHRLLPLAALVGALLTMAADAIARTGFAPREVPLGLVTAALGGPFFLWQLQRGAK
jgi:iron complex transport system permease protein